MLDMRQGLKDGALVHTFRTLSSRADKRFLCIVGGGVFSCKLALIVACLKLFIAVERTIQDTYIYMRVVYLFATRRSYWKEHYVQISMDRRILNIIVVWITVWSDGHAIYSYVHVPT